MVNTTALKQSAQTLNRAKTFSTVGKKLFTNEVVNLNPTAIVSLLRASGVNVPKNAVITADMAQIIISGGAFIDDVEKGASLSSFATPTAAIMQASLDVMGQMGWIDPKSPAAQILTIGADVAMVVAAGGYNVIADLKLAIDLVQMAFSQPDAQTLANADLSKYVSARRRQQTDALSENFKEYHEGNIGIFGLMGKVAEESPDYFRNYFPQYGIFFPEATWSVWFSETTSGAFNSNVQTAYASTSFESLYQHDHATIQKTIWEKLINPTLLLYKKLQDSEVADRKISVQNLGLLSMLPPYVNEFPYDFDATTVLKKYQLTPDDLNDSVVHDYLMDKTRVSLPPISYNGLENHPVPQKYRALTQQELSLYRASLTGRPDILLQDQGINSRLQNWGRPHWIGESFTNTLPTGQIYAQKLTSDVMLTQPQRQFRNYWSALSLLEQIRNDQYFNDMKSQIQTYDFMANLDYVNKRHRELLFKIQTRSLNQMAYKNIASYLGVDPRKLKIVRHGQPGQPAIFQ